MGMTNDCGKMWGYNSDNTRNMCIKPCVEEFLLEQIGIGGNNGPAPECAMNTCLQCDEDNSGPNFAKYAGRTRRNTGLESCITRPCQSNKQLDHEICPKTKVDTSLLWESLAVVEEFDQMQVELETELARDVIEIEDEFQGLISI